MLNRVGYSPEISHGVLVEMAEHRKDLEKETKPILDTLRSYQDLPPVISFLFSKLKVSLLDNLYVLEIILKLVNHPGQGFGSIGY